MSPQNERRKATLISWLVPALLAVITALLVVGGSSVLDYMRDTRADMQGLRRDVQESALQTEKRLTRVEDRLGMKQYADDANERDIELQITAPQGDRRRPKH
jgi:hypothetical protein